MQRWGVLETLSDSALNTHENCVLVDGYVQLDILSEAGIERRVSQLPAALGSIIVDMGMCLHDTHSAPELARNFESTPEQLRERLAARGRSPSAIASE
jgi:hypothetical protein